MTGKLGKRAMFAVVLAATVITTAGALPAQAQSPAAGKLGNQFTYTYYSTAALTGAPVGGWTFGYCPSYFTNSWGTKTSYFVSSEEAC
jgi:hypothetical protein